MNKETEGLELEACNRFQGREIVHRLSHVWFWLCLCLVETRRLCFDWLKPVARATLSIKHKTRIRNVQSIKSVPLSYLATLFQMLSFFPKCLQILEENIGYLVGDCLIAAAFLSYAGPFLSNYRDELVEKTWLAQVFVV